MSLRRNQPSSDDEVDMTPMVDVTFLLLIFFMITAAFALQKAMEVPPVEDDEAAPTEVVEDEEPDIITVRIDEDDVFWVSAPVWDEEKKANSKTDMRSRVREAREGEGGVQGKGPTKLMVKAHGDSTHDHVIAALDAGAQEGCNELILMREDEMY